MTSQPGKYAIAIHILTNISRSKGNEAIIFGQLAENSMKNIFTEYGGGTIPRSISKRSKLRISLDQSSKVLYSLFSLYAKLRAVEIYWK